MNTRYGVFCWLAYALAGFCVGAVASAGFAASPVGRADARAGGGIYLPLYFDDPATPPTRTLSDEEAEAALQRDWLFQAEGKPLERRAAEEIGWARQLAARLARHPRSPDWRSELAELDSLEKRLAEPASEMPVATARPEWIWFPEGLPARDAPAGEGRFFRRAFQVPGKGVVRAELQITADDACAVYLNGVHLGNHQGDHAWRRVAAFAVEKHIRPGRNVLAVRAENDPQGPAGANPAGLIACLTMVLADGEPMHVVTDASWLAAKRETPRWEQPEFDDASWPAAMLAAAGGTGPWRHRLVDADQSHSPYALVAPEVKEVYFAVRRVKRRIALANPVVDFSQLLFIDQPYPTGPETRHSAIHRLGIWATPGGRLLVLDRLHPGGQVRVLAPREKPGSFWRPDLSFDARRVLFCYKAHDEKTFRLYEMNLDGTGLRQLTDSNTYDDIDPIYLPGGHILFTTTRGNSYVRCGPFIPSYILARCDADGNDIYLISHNNEVDFVPSVLHDGRVVYSRWEYTDKSQARLFGLWTTNPDGTGTAHYWGNQSVWPDHLSEPRAIPGSRRVMFSGVGHHDWWSGSIGIIDPDKGRDFPHGLTKITADRPWPEVTLPPVDPIESAAYHSAGRFTGYKTPYPLSEEDFLVSAQGADNQFRLYVMDVYGNRELIYEGAYNALHAIPVRPRQVPPQLPDRVVWPGTGKERKPVEPGVFFSADVYQGMPEVPRGMVKYVRVFQQDYKTYSTWSKSYRHSGPAVSIVQEDAVKRILSEVPVEPDGSVHFVAPAGYTLFFQLLDADGRCLQTMRSFTGLMPGEQRSCLGCHEGHSSSPPARQHLSLALQRPPTELSPPPWGTESITYERFVQPVLDRYCVECHRGDAPDSYEPDLRLRPGLGPFNEPYVTIIGPEAWHVPVPADRPPGYGIANVIPVETGDRPGMRRENDPESIATLRPMQYLSYGSRLIELAESGEHHGVKVDSLSLRRLIAWVDSCGVYMGDKDIRAQGDPDFPGIERLPIRPRVRTAPIIERP